MDIDKVYQIDCLEGVRQLPDNYIDLVILDPPYTNVVKADWDNKNNSNPFTPELANEIYRVCKNTANFYVWCGIGEKSQSLIDFFTTMKNSQFHFKDKITWKKQRGIGMRKGWLFTSEEILWYVKDNKQFIWNKNEQYSDEKRPWNVYKKGGEMVNKSEYKRITNVWTDINEVGYGASPKKFNEIRSKLKHLTPKPVEAIERIIKLHTKENDIVLDCFGGSGTTFVAAKNLNRKFVGFEIDKDCIEVTNERLK